MVLKHKENYVDITLLGLSDMEDYDGFSAGNKVPMDHYGSSSDDVEGGSVDVIFSNSYPDAMSIRPTLISIGTLFCLTVQCVASLLCGSVVTMETPDEPFLIVLLLGVLATAFFCMLVPSFYYWAIETQHQAYVPLVAGNGLGMTTNVVAFLLFMLWGVSDSGLSSSIDYEKKPLTFTKYALLCAAYAVSSLSTVAVYGYSMVGGYSHYIARFAMVRRFVSQQKARDRQILQQYGEYIASSYYPDPMREGISSSTPAASSHGMGMGVTGAMDQGAGRTPWRGQQGYTHAPGHATHDFSEYHHQFPHTHNPPRAKQPAGHVPQTPATRAHAPKPAPTVGTGESVSRVDALADDAVFEPSPFD